MEGQRHATRDPQTNKPDHAPTLECAQMEADSDGSTHSSRPLSGRRRDGADGMACDVAGTEGNFAMNISTDGSRSARVIDSKTLMDGARTILISHEGQEYTLRLTRLGKLLLTK